MSEQSTALTVTRREPAGSRNARRLRREGLVLGTVYGGGQDPISFQIDSRILRNTLASASAVLDLHIDGEKTEPVVLKERVKHPVTGETMHVDLLRVDLTKKIESQVALELTGAEDSEVKIGGVLEQPLREVTLLAVPTEIPDLITHDISSLKINESITLADIVAPDGTEIIGDPETVVAALRSTRSMAAAEGSDAIETETEIVGGDAASSGS